MWFVIAKAQGATLNNGELEPLFQAGWFIFGTLSQIMIVQVIRTRKIPFIQSNASKPLIFSSIAFGIPAILIAFTPIANTLNMTQLPLGYIPWLAAILLLYAIRSEERRVGKDCRYWF